MPEIPQCTWEWDGSKWVNISTPPGMTCSPPESGRPEKGERMTVNCAEPAG